MQALEDRGAVIRWAGRQRAFPVLRGPDPELIRPGDNEAGTARVGWKEFFSACRNRHLVLVVDAPEAFAHSFMAHARAKHELPPAAFGPPLGERVWHSVNLLSGPPRA